MDAVARLEYLLTGYVTGADTLFREIKQLQAGEALIATVDANRWRIETRRYYLFWHSPVQRSLAELAESFETALHATFTRLVRYADGRPVVVPLSGGYDSRLIVLMLRRLGYENVITFSFGQPGNEESEISRSVARALDLPWHFVKYTNDNWYRWYRSPEMRAFLSRCDGLCAFPYITTFPAIRELWTKGVLSNDSVLVPGHTLDFISGGHIPEDLVDNGNQKIEHLIRAIMRKHYNMLISSSFRWTSIRDQMQRRIISRLVKENPRTTEEAVNAYECWEWKERQAKAIVNTARIYEFWGCDWWLPFWDVDIMSFWESVPLQARLRRIFCKLYVEELSRKVLKENIPFMGATTGLEYKMKTLRNIVYMAPTPARRFARKLHKSVRRLSAWIFDKWPVVLARRDRLLEKYRNHKWALYGVLTEEEFLRYQGWQVLPHAFWIWDKLGAIRLSNTGGEELNNGNGYSPESC